MKAAYDPTMYNVYDFNDNECAIVSFACMLFVSSCLTRFMNFICKMKNHVETFQNIGMPHILSRIAFSLHII